MTQVAAKNIDALIRSVSPDRPVLIAGPTASGKSALALAIAQRQGGAIINADASQVYDCWRVLTARPSAQEESAAKHLLYGHIDATTPYSAGHWLREVAPLLQGPERPIIVGGTGLYFMALTQGLADIPATPSDVRGQGDTMSLADLLDPLDAKTTVRIDTANRARVQRAWEVLQATGRNLADWQDDTGPPSKPAHRAIGAPELIAHLRGELTLAEARDKAIIATRQFAKRQRTWFRSKMKTWHAYTP